MNCTRCGHANPDRARFCLECGVPVTQRCASCGTELPAGAKFCLECGAAVAAAAIQTPTAIGPELAPRAYTPKHLADKILQSRSALEGERKQVTVLFADVKGSMELAEQLDPEEWHRILERFFAILTEGVHRFEGSVNQYTGDGIMALFGAPIAHEDHAQRACYAALHLRDLLAQYSIEIKREHGIGFSARMGMNSGEVVVGRIGDDLRMDYTAQGHTVGLAQRMESLAEPGTCYLSGATAQLVSGYFELADLGAFRVKGANEPAHVFELRDVGALRTRFDISRARGLSPFVGRDADMQTLEAALEQARAGNGQVVGIVAEAGTGKSRLCFEFLERCKARGLTTQVGRALAHGKNIPLVPMLEVFRAYFGIADGDADRLVRDKIAGRLLLMDEHFRELLPVVFEFFGVTDASLPMPRMDAETKQRQLFAVLRKVVQEERADGQPVTLIEDLHWIDGASEAFLAQWVEAVAGSHALLVLNFRPEYHAAWMSRSWYRQIPLAPLGAEAVRALLAQLLGSDASTAGLATTIHARSGGNPFFTEEIVQSLIESGALVGSRGAYRLVTPIEQLQVPATVQALLAARIDRLGEGEKQVLQAAAVIGKDFTEPVLQRVLEDTSTTPTSAGDLQSALRLLREGEFILEQSLYPVAEYTFRHPLTQEVALRSQLQERRRRTHAAVARALESAHADRLDEHAALIAHHHDEAGEIANAARWHRRAAEWAGLKDVQAAVRHWLRVRELARQMGDGPEAATLMLAACSGAIALGGWRLGGSVEDWAALFEEGCAAAERAGDLPALATLNSNYGAVSQQTNANFSKAKPYYAEAVRLADRSGIPSLRCGTRILHAISYFWTGPLAEAERLADELIALADGDPRIGAEVTGISPLLGARAFRAHGMGYARDPDEALRELHLVRQVALDSNFPEQALWAVDYEAALRCELDRPDGLSVLAQTAARLAENRDMSATISSRTTIVAALASEGLWQTLLETAVDTLNLIREYQVLGIFESFFLKHISTARFELGDLVGARAAAAEGVAHIRRARGCWSPNSYAALARAQLALHESSVDIAATLDEYSALLARTGFALFEGELHELGAQLAARDGQREKQIAALHLAHAGYVRFGMTARADRVRALIDAPDE